MSEALDRLNTLSRYITIVLKMLMAFFVVLAVVGIVLGVLTVLDPGIFDTMDAGIPELGTMSVYVVFSAFFAFAMIFVLHRLFSNICEEHTPFTDANVRNLKIIAILLLLSAIVTPVAAIIVSAVTGSDSQTYTEFNIGLIFVAFLVYLISLVFRYGAALQKESDETL